MFTVNKLSINTTSHLKIRFGAAGLHLFNRNTGLNLLVNEISLPPSMWSNAPRQVSIALTNACDLACPHCYAPKNPAVLNFERLTNWLTDLDANGCIGVGFGGGEPTLYPRLAELCSYTAEKTGLAVTMTTHAHHLSDRLLKDLAGNVNFIRVSMDGVEATYESLRGRLFATLIQRIRALSKSFPFGINFVVNSKTIDDLDKAIDLAEEFGCSEFLLLPEEATLRTSGIDSDTRRILQEWVANYRGFIPLAVSESGADGLPTCNPLIAETGLEAFAHIDASGILKRTSYSTDGVRITEDRVMPALYKLATSNQEVTS
ncbi:radical SAM protein [Candidatus Synechococcus calcipolaris G9]|uniref:Radical SAM protein n=1 Tax=Candidatus Synechococcus calcipolaris G9 TaxID=1497997 RepID=A0ABT6EXZ2_9SYNE|nr:radical SAM protein [Candidatus Synechococcus calcipolaris]MDG2990656.1 radical SAM protein [Candidatus Synechococcus calcipolaris G9]